MLVHSLTLLVLSVVSCFEIRAVIQSDGGSFFYEAIEMPVVSSEIVDDRIIDGVRRIEERYVDELGRASYCSRTVGLTTRTDELIALIDARKLVIEDNLAELDAIPPPLPEQPDVVFGQGVPNFRAAEGQFYLDTDAFDLYVRLGGAW